MEELEGEEAQMNALQMDKEERQRIEKEILFCVQGVGGIKSVGGMDVYVKNQYCEESIRDLIKLLKRENEKLPVVKHVLCTWKFL